MNVGRHDFLAVTAAGVSLVVDGVDSELDLFATVCVGAGFPCWLDDESRGRRWFVNESL